MTTFWVESLLWGDENVLQLNSGGGYITIGTVLNATELYALKVLNEALAGVAQWIECRPANQRVASSIPSQGTCLGCGPGPQWRPCKRQPHTDVSLPLFLPPFLLSKNK